MAPTNNEKRELALYILRVLQEKGHVAYLAGGCVRDALLGLEPKDFDVATEANPNLVMAYFKGSRYVGEAFGVVLVTRGNVSIEIATFRSEWGYTDGRRPSRVAFTDAEHDAARRDFTINGLFENPLAPEPRDRIIDFVNGRKDLEAKIIRAIGTPKIRFQEDFLRMLRAVRFAGALDFKIDPDTAAAIQSQSDQLSRISRERIGQEVRAMLIGPRPHLAATLAQQLKLDSSIFNEEHLDVPLPTLKTLAVVSGADYAAALTAWMFDRHLLPQLKEPASPEYPQAIAPLQQAIEQFKNESLNRTLGRWRMALCMSNDERDILANIVTLLARVFAWPAFSVARRKRLLAHPHWTQACAVLSAMTHRPSVAAMIVAIRPQIEQLVREGVAPPRFVTGDDLVALGHRPGPNFGHLLEQVYDRQLELTVKTREEALAWIQQRLKADAAT